MENRFEISKGDITTFKVDAIVNAANQSLLGGGGVDGAIHKAAGQELLAECRKLNGCKTGEAKITKGYKLPASWVIHTVGPIWNEGNNEEGRLLSSCYKNSLLLADAHNLKTVAFPSISTGAYSFPIEIAAQIAVKEILDFLQKNNTIDKVIMVCYGDDVFKAYMNAYKKYNERVKEVSGC